MSKTNPNTGHTYRGSKTSRITFYDAIYTEAQPVGKGGQMNRDPSQFHEASERPDMEAMEPLMMRWEAVNGQMLADLNRVR